MWRPRALGTVIAERALTLDRPRRRSTVVRVKFGRPVRAPRPQRGDPWWCPVQISGLGKREIEKVPGEDSLQALTLALEHVCRVLPFEADRAGIRLEWLGERESLVFANTMISSVLARNLQNCITAMGDAIDVLENGGTGAAARATALRLRALIASGGFSAGPRQGRQRSAPALE